MQSLEPEMYKVTDEQVDFMLHEISQFPLNLISDAKCAREAFGHEINQYLDTQLQESRCFYDFIHF